MKGMYTAATGMDAQVMRIDTIANNLANADTTGFKKSQVDFADLIYETRQGTGGTTQQTTKLTPLELGSGVSPVSTLKIFTAGAVSSTGGELDLAIGGDGFFQVETPTGEIMYTRDGNFRVDPDGNMVNSQGYPMEPSISVPDNAIRLDVGMDGTVSATMPDGSESEVGNIQLASFVNPAGLSSQGGNLYRETTASGPPTTGTPTQNGLGELRQGYLEKSNVDVVGELVDLISAQRTYELNSKVVKAGDKILRATNYIAG